MKRILFFLCSILLLISFTACENALSSDIETDKNGVHKVPGKVPPPSDVIVPSDSTNSYGKPPNR